MLCLLIKKDQFVRNLSAMTGDTRTMFETLGQATPSQADPEWRVMDPFDHLYRCIYQLTMRIVGAEEIADDSKLLDETLERFESFESHSSLTKVVFPWMITINHILRLYNGARLAMVIQRIIDHRKNTGKRREDALQFLLDDGASLRDIISVSISRFTQWATSCADLFYLLVHHRCSLRRTDQQRHQCCMASHLTVE